MADSHPYISGAGNIAQMVSQLRKAFPPKVTSDTVKRLGLAPNNESYVINALQFVGVIDSEGNKTDEASEVFSHHNDEDFNKAFGGLVKQAYSELFELHGDSAWSLDDNALITYFRRSDKTSDTIGKRQAKTFRIFSALSGCGELPSLKNGKTKAPKRETKSTVKSTTIETSKASPESLKNTSPSEAIVQPNLGLSVRVEINLPADASKETYDNIFRSIRENLLNG